ncbi:type I secretion system permease/ATPase [Aureimonas leprariae]|uniref:Type I secretion system permease/ATPase n=1 Tax=Plantimonas leprariae TaxID=2615207 RepID=A0A7V7PM19_9HYPH|nr:type I secretion system permease/ATPase [Aureimonas leprariae]KAB0677699.1 type I secretion system permease/ATPase [Aureimonas leprariae]
MSGLVTSPEGEAQSELRTALKRCTSALVGVGLLSGMLNVLYLTGSFFMLEVYDRVLPSRSVPTLVGLIVIAGILYAFQGVIDVIRGRILSRIGGAIDEAISPRAFQAITRLPLQTANVDSTQGSRDLDSVRGFMSGLGPTAFFDLPWMPLYLGICFAFHPAIGWAAFLGGVVLIALTILTERLTKNLVKRSTGFGSQRNSLSEVYRRNAEVLRAMGMEGRMGQAWGSVNSAYNDAQLRAADVTTLLGSISKTFRMVLQSAVLAVGAYLVINQEATGGIIIASSILSSRALAPIELVIGQWKSFVGARQSWARLESILAAVPAETQTLDLPEPKRSLIVEDVTIVPPGSRTISVQDVTLQLTAGQGLGVIGPSASGKSSLIRAIVGAWTPVRGAVRLDGAALQQWSPERLGVHLGYLPQDVQLFGGTIAQNIARFDPEATDQAVIAAARAAGVHDMIVRLPEGYATNVGDGGQALSAGQRQRVGLARALYGDPFLVVLDEPNSNLDGEGEEALTQAILSVRKRQGIVVVVAHRPTALASLNLVLVMREGRAQAFGPKDEVLGNVLRPVANASREPAVPELPAMQQQQMGVA